jgi:MFS family permease
MGTTVLFMLAQSVAWLFVARAIQGLATGAALSAASAALLDRQQHSQGSHTHRERGR